MFCKKIKECMDEHWVTPSVAEKYWACICKVAGVAKPSLYSMYKTEVGK